MQKMARNATEEQKSCRVEQHGADCQEIAYGTAVQQFQAAEEARAVATREAAVETSREGGC